YVCHTTRTFSSSSILAHNANTLFPYTTLFRSASIANFAANAGASQVELVTPLWSVCEDLDAMQKPELYRLLAENQVVLSPNQQRSEEHTSELQSRFELVCRLLLAKKITSQARS